MTVKKKYENNTDLETAAERLGRELRGLRKAHGMTLEELSEVSDKSISFLSKIERGQARPSITALQDIAEALKVPIGWFFQNEENTTSEEHLYIVRSDKRRKLTYASLTSTDYMGFQDFLLSANLDGKLALGMSVYEPGGTAGDDQYNHEGEEAGFVLEGEIQLTLDGKTFELKTGDSFSFSSQIPHTYTNVSNVTAKIIWANTPVTLRR